MRTDRLSDPRTDQFANPTSTRSETERSSIIETIGQNSAEINWEYAVIERLDDHDLSTRLIPFRLANAVDDRSSSDNQPLKAGDVVTIFSRTDLELPMEKHSSFVRVGGEVNAPGVYRVNPGETLREVVVRAGGLTSHSYLYASLLTRVSTRHAQEEQLRQSTEQMQRELDRPGTRMRRRKPARPARISRHNLQCSKLHWRGSLRLSRQAASYWI